MKRPPKRPPLKVAEQLERSASLHQSWFWATQMAEAAALIRELAGLPKKA